ncbi:hypothetical protein [Chryseobacterium terrae]|uniref:Piwi domain-containing protein n=1 Tax=Chryseobacterium terrae TaxID=3163299 RepID=A0ABW8Y480_9FLAO
MSTKVSDGIYAVGGNRVAMVFSSAKNLPAHSLTKIKKSNGDSDICNWGDDNLYPLNFDKKFRNSGTAIGGHEVLYTSHFGTGFSLYKETAEGETNDYVAVPFSQYPEIYQFFRKVKIDLFYKAIIKDYEKWGISFVEYLLTPNSDKVISIKRHDASWCRFQVPNESTGMIENIIVNSDWESRDKNLDVIIPCFDQMFSVEEIKEEVKKRKITRFVICHMDTLSIQKVYPLVGWHSSFRNGWMDVVLAIPELKKYMFENQLNWQFLAYIADDYFAHIYQDAWKDMSNEEKEAKRVDLVNKIDDKISGNKGAGTSIISPFFRDKNTGELIKGIQVEAIKKDNTNGDFLLDASAGNSEILFPMGVDPCLLGAGIPGGKNLSGSGSDKREAYTILCSRLPAKHAVTLEIFLTIRDWNGWPQELIGKFPNVQLTTLDKNPTGQSNVVM